MEIGFSQKTITNLGNTEKAQKKADSQIIICFF